MSSLNVLNDEEQFIVLLTRYSEALSKGGDTEPPADASLSPELRQRLRRALDCLRRLRRLPSPPPPSEEAITAVMPASRTLHEEMVVRQVGRFRILRTLGAGGGGIVFLAFDPELRREVALKIPRLDALLMPEPRQRFLREARAAASLDHANLVPVHEVGEANGLCFLVSAYCRGGSLCEWLMRRIAPVPVRQAAELLAVLADAVQYVHEHGIVHRDIKPGNILLDSSTVPPAGELRFVPRLTDFGLAKLRDAQTEATHSGALLGTPSYMAPEQVDGRLRDIGPRTDVYGLGAVLFEVLAGRPPFRGMADTDTLRQVLADEPPLRRARSNLPRDLETICLKCLEKQPSRRYASAAELAGDLRRFLGHEPIRARSPGRLERLGKWAQRRPARAILLAAALLIALAVTAGELRLAGMKRRHEAERAATAKQGEEQKQILHHKEQLLRQHHYAEDIALAWRAWSNRQRENMKEPLQRHHAAPGLDDPRGFEWHYLSRLADTTPPRMSLSWLGHHQGSEPREAWAVAFSPDGKTLASAGDDRAVRLWDTANGRARAALAGHGSLVTSLAFTPDGRFLASAGFDRTIKLWDMAEGAELATLQGHTEAIDALAVSPDGKFLASAGRDRVARLWDTLTGAEQAIVAGHPIISLAFSPDGRTLALATTVQTVFLWDMQERKVRRTLSPHPSGHVAVAFSPDSKTLATGDAKGAVRFWDAAAGQLRACIRHHADAVNCLAFTPDGKTLASASFDKRVKLWQTTTGRELLTLPEHQERVRWLAFSADGAMLATAGHDGILKIYRAADRQE